MKHFKVRVQYLNGVEFVHECKTLTNWQAGAIARVEGRRLGLGGAMDVKETIVEDWAGKQVTLFASTTKLKGDIVECLRIRPIVTIPAKPKLPDERFKSAMIALKEGTVTVLKLRTSYDLTQDQLDQIKEVEDAKNTM